MLMFGQKQGNYHAMHHHTFVWTALIALIKTPPPQLINIQSTDEPIIGILHVTCHNVMPE